MISRDFEPEKQLPVPDHLEHLGDPGDKMVKLQRTIFTVYSMAYVRRTQQGVNPVYRRDGAKAMRSITSLDRGAVGERPTPSDGFDRLFDAAPVGDAA